MRRIEPNKEGLRKNRIVVQNGALSIPSTCLFPLPVVMISSSDKENHVNVCTVSWIGVVSSKPYQIGIGLRKTRLSHQMISKSGEFVINIPTKEMIHIVDYCGLISGEKRNKFKDCKLTVKRGKYVKAPLIKNCPVNYECKVTLIIEAGSHDFIIGKVLASHVNGKVKNGKQICVNKVNPLTLCGNEYWSIGKRIGKVGIHKRIEGEIDV